MPDRSSPDRDCLVCLNSDSLHDLSSPVNQIRTISELLLKRYGGTLDAEAETLLGFIQESSGRLQNLVAGLRTYMRVLGSPGDRRRCDMNTLLHGAKACVQPEIDQNGAVVTSGGLPEIYCEPTQIQYILASLIENAIKFRREPKPEIHVSGTLESSVWVFSVRDNGVGIASKHIESIFGMFKRIESDPHRGRFKRIENDPHGGPGVGLAIARQVVQQHGGRMWVESQAGAGATFFFTLPQPGSPA